MKTTLILAAAIALGGCEQNGRYQISPGRSAPQQERVWILDTQKGVLSMCFDLNEVVQCMPPKVIASPR